MSKRAIIVAIDSKNGFAKTGKIPWYYPEDFKHFREITVNNICVMGKNTYLEIDDKLNHQLPHALPNRLSVILTSTLNQSQVSNALTFGSIVDFLDILDRETRDIFFIGGQSIFDIALKFVDTLYITHIKKDYECDQFFDMKYVNENFYIDELSIGDNPELMFYKYTRNK